MNEDIDHDGDIDDADLSLLMENWTGSDGIATGPGDLDGDGDIDDADLGMMYAAWTGPMPEDTIDSEAINHELTRNDSIKLPSGSTVIGGIVAVREHCTITCEGPIRAKVIPKRGESALIFKNMNAQVARVWGLHLYSQHRDLARGVSIRLNANDGKYCRSFSVQNCKIENFDTSIEAVDDWARKQPTGTPGRIRAQVMGNIIGPSYGSDSHSIGLYAEGWAEGGEVFGNYFDHSGWIVPQDRNKRSHCIYAQSFGARMHRVVGNVFSRPSANAAQFRIGCDLFANNIITGAPLGPWFGKPGGVVRDNILLDQYDISPDERRGHGYMLAGNMTIEHNLAARRHGSMASVAAFGGVYSPDAYRDNVAVQWSKTGHNFELDGKVYTERGTNRTIMADPGIPVFAEHDRWANRPLGVGIYSTKPFIDACWRAINAA